MKLSVCRVRVRVSTCLKELVRVSTGQYESVSAVMDSLLLQVHQALLSPLQTLQVLHQLPHVVSGLPSLDIGEPAATQRHQDGQTQDQILPLVMSACIHKYKHSIIYST